MKTCTECGEEKPLSEFYFSQGSPRSRCKRCHNLYTGQKVGEWRRRAKETLVREHGGRCLDCGYEGPPFMFDFDHRDPSQKEFEINGRLIKSIDRLRTEAEKCDLVCSNCHRWRTHRQRCQGCEHCEDVVS